MTQSTTIPPKQNVNIKESMQMALKRRRNSGQDECTTSNHDDVNETDEVNYIVCDTPPCVQYKISIDLYNDHVEKTHS